MLLPLSEAQDHVLQRARASEPVTVVTDDARGLVLGADVISTEAVPPFANSAMDGYAVVAADTAGASPSEPVVLPVVAEIAAGHPAPRALQRGEAMRIFTGAPVPDGADAIVIVERTQRISGGPINRTGSEGASGRDRAAGIGAAGSGEHVQIEAPAVAGDHIRPAGDDVRPGEVVLTAGEQLTAGHLGVLRTIGVTDVPVHRRPRVGVLSTGDELVEDGRPLAPGEIRESNRASLLALLAEDGFDGVDLGIAPDTDEAIASALEDGAASCHAVLTSGGVSMGDIDLVKVVLDRIGDMRWMQIAIRPAKPFAFGLVGDRRIPVFGLPGNPVSSMVSYELLARPALRRMAGHPEGRWLRPAVAALAAEDLRRKPDGKLHLARVTGERDEDGVLHVRSAGGQGSHQLTGMARAHGLALLPDGDGIDRGQPVRVLLRAEI